MTGLEKIVNQILEDAKQESDMILTEAREKAEGIIARANEDAKNIQDEIAVKSEKDIENYKKRAESSTDLKKRTAILKAKQETISLILEEAYKTLCQAEPKEYFARVERMLTAYVQPKNGEIRFSQADLDRMPKDFSQNIEAAARAAGGSLKLSEEGADIENGFVLVYGGVEENCTLRAVFDVKKDELTDKVHKLLYM